MSHVISSVKAAAHLFRPGTLFESPLALALALVSLLVLAPAPQVQAASKPDAGKYEKLVITTKTGKHAFQVEVMRKPDELARGLMFRRTMAKDKGMLFDFREVKPVAMWMRNTYLPLDMVFIDQHGVVANVAENTEPLSEANIVSERPVLSVLEVNAGTARRIGLKAGDIVTYKLFKPR